MVRSYTVGAAGGDDVGDVGGKARARRGRWIYPSIVELGLDANHVALALILRAQDIQLGGIQRPVGICGLGYRAQIGGRAGGGEGITNVSASSASVNQVVVSSMMMALQAWAIDGGVDSHGSSVIVTEGAVVREGRRGGRRGCVPGPGGLNNGM